MTTLFRAPWIVNATALMLAFGPQGREGQKALVYCPVEVDASGCSRVVKALTDGGEFAGGVERGYIGADGTVDLKSADLSAYSVIVVPSLADDATDHPYALLRDPAVAERIRAALRGRQVFFSGTPDQGASADTRVQKDALIRNLARWAAVRYMSVKGPGLVVLQDQSEDADTRYTWARDIVGYRVLARPVPSTYARVRALTAAGREVLANRGSAMSYTNIASFGLSLPDTAAGVASDIVSDGADQNMLMLTRESATLASTAADPGFSFLAPLGTGTADPATFDAHATPVVEICAWANNGCMGAPIARFSTAPNGTELTLTANVTTGRFEASWNLLSTTFTTRKTYRIRVVQSDAQLGFVLVDVVRGRWALTAPDGSVAPLASANALPVQFALRRSGPAGAVATTYVIGTTVPAAVRSRIAQVASVYGPASAGQTVLDVPASGRSLVMGFGSQSEMLYLAEAAPGGTTTLDAASTVVSLVHSFGELFNAGQRPTEPTPAAIAASTSFSAAVVRLNDVLAAGGQWSSDPEFLGHLGRVIASAWGATGSAAAAVTGAVAALHSRALAPTDAKAANADVVYVGPVSGNLFTVASPPSTFRVLDSNLDATTSSQLLFAGVLRVVGLIPLGNSQPATQDKVLGTFGVSTDYFTSIDSPFEMEMGQDDETRYDNTLRLYESTFGFLTNLMTALPGWGGQSSNAGNCLTQELSAALLKSSAWISAVQTGNAKQILNALVDALKAEDIVPIVTNCAPIVVDGVAARLMTIAVVETLKAALGAINLGINLGQLGIASVYALDFWLNFDASASFRFCTAKGAFRECATRITVTPSPVQLTVGKQVTLSPTVYDRNAQVIPEAYVEGFQLDRTAPPIALIGLHGDVRAMRTGATTVRMKTGDVFVDVPVTVTEPCSGMSCPPPPPLCQGSGCPCPPGACPSPNDPPPPSPGPGTSSNDPHLKTMDGRFYDFHGIGDFVLARSVVDNGFEIHSRYKRLNPWVSVNDAVAARVGADVVNIYPATTDRFDVIVNESVSSAVQTMAAELPSGGAVQVRDGAATISWPDGSSVVLRKQSLEVYLTGSRRGSVEGLLGNFDGDRDNDLRIRGGAQIGATAEELYTDFRTSWRVPLGGANGLFRRGPDPWDAAPPGVRSWSEFDADAIERARAACLAAGVLQFQVLTACMSDILLTGDFSWAAVAASVDPKIQRISVTPGLSYVRPGENRLLTAIVTGVSTPTVTWSAAAGTINGDGLTATYTPPAVAGEYFVTASVAGSPGLTTTVSVVVAGKRTWVGGSSQGPTNWEVAANWQPQIIPTDLDNVFIPAGAATNPTLSGFATVKGLSVSAGLTLNVLGRLTATGDATIEGALTGAGALVVAGNASTAVGSTVTVGLLQVGGVLAASGVFSPGTTSFTGTNQLIPSASNYQYKDVEVHGTATFSAPATLIGSLTINGGGAVLSVGGGTTKVGGGLTVGSRLRLTDATAVLSVDGSVQFTGSAFGGAQQAADLAVGQLRVGGNFSLNGSSAFVATGTTVVFTGSGTQTVSNTSGAGNQFYHVEVAGTGSVNVGTGSLFPVAGNLTVKSGVLTGGGQLVVAGAVTTAAGTVVTLGQLQVGGVLAASGIFSPGTTYFTGTNQLIPSGSNYQYKDIDVRGTATLSASATLAGSLMITGPAAVLNTSAGTTRVAGRLAVGGRLRLTDAGAVLVVDGAAQFNGGVMQTGDLVAGQLRVGGNFSVEAGNAFLATGTTVAFTGSGTQTVSVVTILGNQFYHVDVAGTGSVSVGTETLVPVAGNLTVTSGTLTGGGQMVVAGAVTTAAGTAVTLGQLQVGGVLAASGVFSPGTTSFTGTNQLIPGGSNYQYKDIDVRRTATLSAPVTLAGSLTINGGAATLNISAGTTRVAGGLIMSGRLRLTDAAAVLAVDGAVQFNGGAQQAGDLAAGQLRVGGNFSVNSGNAFLATGTTVVFNGSGTQTVSATTTLGNQFFNVQILSGSTVNANGLRSGGSLDIGGVLNNSGTSDVADIILRSGATLNNSGVLRYLNSYTNQGGTVTGAAPVKLPQ